jgi:hypothetical protein
MEDRQKKNARQRRYYQAHREKCRAYYAAYHLGHREEMQVYNAARYLNLKQQFMGSVYGHLCFFCKRVVLIEDLARHHINGDGNEDRTHLGGSRTASFVRSWTQAIAEQDPMKWATAHKSCHASFHNHKTQTLTERERHQIYYDTHKQELKEYNRRYHLAHRQEICERHRKYRSSSREGK